MRKRRDWHHLLLKLRRRRIIETLGAFIAGGWLILEFVHWALIMHYHLPEKIFDISLVSIICALLCTLLWRWFRSHESRPRKIKAELVLIPLIITAAFVTNVYFILQMKVPEEEIAWKTAWKNSIAVLPFQDLSRVQDHNDFCEGISDDIITKLGSIEGLRTLASKSSSLYKNSKKSMTQIGRELKVDWILVGTLQVAQDRLRVNVQLIDGKKGFNIWTKSYMRKIDNCFDVQDEIAADMARELKMDISKGKIDFLKKREPVNYKAYQAYQWGKIYEKNYREGLKKEDLEKSQEWYQQAIALDKNYVLAYVGLGNLYEAHYVRENDEADADQMAKFYQKAYELDQEMPEANLGLGWLYFYRGLNDLSYNSFKKAFELDPTNAEVNASVGSFLRSLGLYEKAAKYFLRAIETDPFTISHYSSAANCYFYYGEYEKAIRMVRLALGIEPDNWRLHLNYARQLLMLGRYGEAEVEVDRAEKINSDSGLVRRHRAWLLAARGEVKKSASLISENDKPYSYEMTMIAALLGKTGETVDNIRTGIRVGFEEMKDYLYSYQFLASNPFYKPLLVEPEFQNLLKVEKAKYEEKLNKYAGL
ncbi:MAG: FlgO family outer membrane protein [Candidatus Saccharicenans sp.]